MGSNSYGLPVKAGLHETFLSDFPADMVSRGARIGRVNTIVRPIREANLCFRRSQFDWQSAAILKRWPYIKAQSGNGMSQNLGLSI